MPKLPTYDSLMNPLIQALRQLGGSGSIDEIYEQVVEIENISEDVIAKLHDPEKSNQTEVAYRLAWARTYLKKFGFRGMHLTPETPTYSMRGCGGLPADAGGV